MSDNYLVTSISPDCFEYDEEDEVEEIQPINEWIREYARIAGPKLLHPTVEEVTGAIKDHFPELIASNLDLDQLLDTVGIQVIADHKDYRIAWLGTDKKEEADKLLYKFQQPSYSDVRRKLKIDYLWILNLRPNLGHSRNDIFEADVDFSLIENKPECIIINL